jgi:hypothetical protein
MSDEDDVLLRVLRELPHATHDEHAAEALRRKAREAYVRAERSQARALADRARGAAMPLVLAGIVGVYLSWAIGAAMSVGM